MGKNKIKAIAIDLDGTLLDSKSLVSVKNRQALQACSDEGIKIIISSAKTARYIRVLMDDLLLKDPQICSGGALIIDEQPKPLYELKISPSYVKQIIKYARESGEGTTVACSNGNLYYESWHKNLKHILDSGIELIKTDDLSKEEIVNNTLMFSITIEQDNRLDNFLREQYDNQLQITRGGRFFLTILDMQASKVNALKIILSMFDIARENVLAIGDSQNDLDSLHYAGKGIAMGNATEELKKMADHIVEDNENDGVAHAIYRFALI